MIRTRLRHLAGETRRAARQWRSSIGVPVGKPGVVAAPEAVELTVYEWSVYRGVLRARFAVTDRATGKPPTHAYFVQGDWALRVRLRATEEQSFSIRLPSLHVPELTLAFGLPDGRVVNTGPDAGALALATDRGGEVFGQFLKEMTAVAEGRVLEIGSRARSGTVYAGFVPEHLDYTGLDIVAGPNVDVVGDAHELESLFAPEAFSVVFSIAVFEHLAMPWKAALSINAVMKEGGIVYVGTHQTFPVHEAPWDYWRFSDQAWRSLFNPATGFEIIDAAMGQPADIVPLASIAPVWGIDREQPGFLTSSVLARKIGPSSLRWPVQIDQLSGLGMYPN